MPHHSSSLICVGVIASAHGVKGEFKIKSYTSNPADIRNYGLLLSEEGDELPIIIRGSHKDGVIARMEGVGDRDVAEQMRGTYVFVSRNALPDLDGHEYYYEDLIGMKALDAKGNTYGVVRAMHNFGAGDVIEITLEDTGKTKLFSFTQHTVPEVDIKAGTLVIIPPQEVE